MNNFYWHIVCVGFGLGLVSCGVPDPDSDTGGLGPDFGAQENDPAGRCARGLVVLSTDYQSTSVGLLAPDGDVLSERLISSASAEPGLSAALTGDVVAPSMTLLGDELLLIDRYPAGVLSWLSLETGEVRAQLSVNTGFAANPHDYIPISPDKAYVSRFEPNFAAGQQLYDGGNDLLILDPSIPAITGRIDLAETVAPGYFPRADRALRAGRWVVVVLGALSEDFTDSVESAIAVLDTSTDSLHSVFPLLGLHGCSSLVLSPDGSEVAIACSGRWNGDATPESSSSAVMRVAIDSETGELEEVARYMASDFEQGPLGFGLSYASPELLLLTTFGQFALGSQPATDDTLLTLDLVSSEHEVLLRSSGEPFTLGDVRCECGVCFASDAGRAVVQRLELTGKGRRLEIVDALSIDPDGRLPPRYLGAY